jgi:hypothetical protein
MQPYSGSNDEMKNMAIKDILNSLYKTATGTHIIVVYPHVTALKNIYAYYIQRQLANGEIVLILSYYETVERIKKYLQDFENDGGEMINVDKYLSEGSLLVVDSTKAFFNHKPTVAYDEDIGPKNSEKENIVSLIKILKSHSKKLNKHNITILVDLGCFFNMPRGVECLLKYENSIPQMFNNSLKQFCFYSQTDFEQKFSVAQKAELLDRHGRTVLMLDN